MASPPQDLERVGREAIAVAGGDKSRQAPEGLKLLAGILGGAGHGSGGLAGPYDDQAAPGGELVHDLAHIWWDTAFGSEQS